MINSLAGFLTSLASWCEGCQCHEEDLLANQTWYARAKVARQNGASCCYKGRRAPELASGHLSQYIDWLASSAMADVVGFCDNLTSEEQVGILNDWNCAVDRTLFEITLKTEHWKLLPWSLAVIGHHDLDQARAGLRRCRDQFLATDPQMEHLVF